jgi:hypothetical protein
MKEKWTEFVTMLGGDEEMARSVVKQAQDTEEKADQAGLKFKEGETDPALADKAKKGAEGTPEEEKTEPKAEAETEGDEPLTAKSFGKKFMPQIEKKMSDMLSASRKETTEKEAGLEAQITALEAKLKEAQGVIATLAGDLPRGVKAGYRASLATETVTTKEAPNTPKADPLGDMYSWMTTSLGSKPG